MIPSRTLILWVTIAWALELSVGSEVSNGRTPPDQGQTSQSSPAAAEATRLSSLVVTLFKEGKFDEALPLAKQALGITEKLFVEGDPQIDIALNNLGEVYFAKKDYASAKGVYQRLLASKEKKLGDDVTLSPILDRLAFLFYAERNFHNSEESYKRALFLREKNLGSSSAEV